MDDPAALFLLRQVSDGVRDLGASFLQLLDVVLQPSVSPREEVVLIFLRDSSLFRKTSILGLIGSIPVVVTWSAGIVEYVRYLKLNLPIFLYFLVFVLLVFAVLSPSRIKAIGEAQRVP